MPLPDPLWVLVVVNAALIGAVGYLGFSIRKLRLYALRLAQDKGKAINAELIELWRRQRHRLPEGSKKRAAYTARLIEVGELDPGGNEWP